jgi:hypothetical protein
MHSPHATWETGLVIPEATKTTEEQMLAALLRIEDLLGMLLSAVQDKGPLDTDPSHSMAFSEPKPAKKPKAK